ncbi:hypothetical protein DPMN_186306 [Dreissena polymorpha]|nr:hypothetical protein DPMN_186306 [Dreissena polymorpha]
MGDITVDIVEKHVSVVHKLIEDFNEDSLAIMEQVANASKLLDFVKEIDADVRNLIDAVEDISESHVQESTVSALIEAKQFLHPIVQHQAEEHNIFSFLRCFYNEIKQLKDAKTFPAKICECMENVHNLKSLYHCVANRGQQRRKVIKSIVLNGEFVFDLHSNNVILIATYSISENKYSISETALVDLRSRALLLLNTDRHSEQSNLNSEELNDFVNLVDCTISTKKTLLALHMSGHMDYFEYKQSVSKTDLESVIEKLNTKLNKWNNELNLCRCKYYLLNYFNGCQVNGFYNYLERNTSKKHNSSEKDVNTFLKFIHRDFDIVDLKDKYSEMKTSLEGESFLFLLGKCLDQVYKDRKLTPQKRVVKVAGEKINTFAEICHEGRLMLLNLEENSDFVVRTILALYYNTFQCLPEPSHIMFCSVQTSFEDIDLLIERCLGAKAFHYDTLLFCIAYVENLSSEKQIHLVDRLREIEKSEDFRLAVICRGSKHHPFVDILSEFMSMVQPVSDKLLATILYTKFENVTTYTSEVAGLGKSSVISMKARKNRQSVVTLHVSGHVSRDKFVAELKQLNLKNNQSLHLDIGSVNDPRELDTLVFELIVLSYIAVGRTAFACPTSTIYIEIANSINNSLQNSLPTVTSFKKKHLSWKNFDNYIASKEPSSPNQVVCHYLKALQENTLDLKEVHVPTDRRLSKKECRELLRSNLGLIPDISYSIVHTFLNVLADQLKKFSCSVFFRLQNISDMVGGKCKMSVRSSLVKTMVEISIEFACRSVQSCRSTQLSTLTNDESQTKVNDIATNLVHRTESMVKWEDSNHLMYVFHNQNIQTLSPVYRDKKKVPEAIQQLFETQLKRQLENYVELDQCQLQDILQRVARTNPLPLSKETLSKMTSQYALTPDNLLKMILIMFRIQTNVPVLVMGETGCGKTSLIRYLAGICEVPFTVLNIHAGITNENVIDIVLNEHEQCLKNPNQKRWLFIDEINTTECIGLICDIIRHRTCRRFVLAPNLTVIGACNPYKIRTSEAICTAGLSGKVKTDELSKLVYRVLPLPEMIVDYVWDFGSLSDTDEKKYIERMSEPVFGSGSEMHTLLRDLISASQIFVRLEEKNTCVVSLRDVGRCIILVSWFLKVIHGNVSLFKKPKEVSGEIKSIVLALTHCYHSRFTKKETRKLYRQLLVRHLLKPTREFIQAENDVNKIIEEAQSEFLYRMELPSGTAKNTALKENIFMILVCILNKIPIFVVGKPGCSKSLAMNIIRSNVRGKDSKDEFFKTQPQLYCVSFQGSESSTSDGILKVFEKAEKYQESNNVDDVLSVVILDEIGLAEISRFNPLKVLHNLLEPNGKSFPNVAVVGISNWSLDASKMNRAVHVSKPDMDKEELFDTATSICQSFVESIKHKSAGMLGTQSPSKFHLSDISVELKSIAHAYLSYTDKLQFKHFHGLRDFYALVKFISKTLATQTVKRTDGKSIAIMEGLQRNFGGLKSERRNLVAVFEQCISNTNKDRQVLDLIADNINDTFARHLMVITSGESVLGLLEKILQDAGRNKPEIIFGSQFEEDLTDDYHYRILSKIILCMEEGIILILKDLEHIYGSLYDMLNQNYTRFSKKNTCRIALGPYSNPFCPVSDSFRCIVLVEANQLHKIDPPFLSRFEKQYLSFADILTDDEKQLAQQINVWIDRVSTIEGRSFTKHDIFPFYNDDLIISLVILVKRNRIPNVDKDFNPFSECIKRLMWIMTPDAVLRLRNASDENVRMESRQILIDYFKLPLHEGLETLIAFHHKQNQIGLSKVRMFVVFTNSNIHTRLPALISGLSVQTENLGTFKSEKKLSNKLRKFWQSDTNVLLIHCHAADDEHHLTLTMYLVNKIRIEEEEHIGYKLVYMILHMGVRIVHGTIAREDDLIDGSLEKINFLSGWDLLTLESLQKPVYSVPCLSSQTLKQAIDSMRPLEKYLHDELFWSFTRIGYSQRSRNVESVLKVIADIQSSKSLLPALENKIVKYIEDTVGSASNEEWCVHIACNANALNTSSLFADALLRHIISTIKSPLAKLIIKLEQVSALDSFFIDDNKCVSRQNYWLSVFNSPFFSIITIDDETGLERFQCSTPDLGLKVPFGRQIYDDIESTRDTFMMEVASAKVKCDIEANTELPRDVMKELIKHHEDIVSLKTHFNECAGYNSQCLIDDYWKDYCNLLSYKCCYGLQPKDRIEITLWAMNKIVNFPELATKSPIEALVFLHCTGWTHISKFNALIQLCSEFDAGFSSVVSQVSELKSKTMEDEHIADDMCDEETRFGCFVSHLCSVAIPTKENHTKCKKDTHWENVLRNLVLAVRNISDSSKEYQALRLCSDIYSIAVVRNKISEDLIFDLGMSLTNNDIDSSLVQDNIEKIIQDLNKSGASSALFRIVRQYLISCISSNEDTDFAFFFKLLNTKMIPINEMHLLKFPFEVRIDCEVYEDMSVLKNIIRDNQNAENNQTLSDFFHLLDKCLNNIMPNKNETHPFYAMITDLLESQFYKCVEPYDSDLILASGRVLQTKHTDSIGLKFITSVAYIRAFIRYLCVRENLIEEALVDAYAFMLNGLEKCHYRDLIHNLMLKYILNGECITDAVGGTTRLATGACISGVANVHDMIADKKGLRQKLNLTKQYAKTCFEFNTLCHYVDKELLIQACKCFEIPQNNSIKLKSNLDNVLKAHTKPDDNAHRSMLAFIISLKEFYLPKYIKMLNDTEKLLAWPLEMLFVKCFTSAQKELLRCTLGLEDFEDSRLVPCPQMKYQQFVWNSVLVSSFALALAYSGKTHDVKASAPVTQCLLYPLEQSVFSLSGFSCKPTHNSVSPNKTTSLYYCNCGTVMLFHQEYSKDKCKTCGSDVDTIITPSEQLIKTELFKNESPTQSNLSPISQKIFQFFGDGGFLGSLALRITKPEQVFARFPDIAPSNNIFDFIWARLKQHWDEIKGMLNAGDFETGMFFHLIMQKGTHLLFKDSLCSDKNQDISAWETKFEHVVAGIEDNLFEEISFLIRDTDTKFGLSSTSVELHLRESAEAFTNDCCLFRQTRVATKSDFRRQLYRRKEDFPFLQYVVDNEDILSLPVHIYNFIQWHLVSVANINFNLKRNECLEKTVNEYQALLKENKAKVASTNRFKQFKASWNALSKQCPGLKLKFINIKSKMCDCLLLSQEGQIYRVLKLLIDTQNQCIHNALHLAKQCSSLQFLLRSPEVSSTRSVLASEIRKDDLIAIDGNWVDFINQESHCGLQYGEGRHINYDFQNIEKRLAEKLLFGKAHVSFNDLPNIVFRDELYRNFLTLVQEVRIAVKQAHLPQDLELSLRKKM